MVESARPRFKLTLWHGVSAALFLALMLVSWRAYALDAERDLLSERLRTSQEARFAAERSARSMEMRFANYVLENRVRGEIVDERMVKQEQRSAELEREAEAVRLQKLMESDCITPRSVIGARGL